MVLNRKDFNDNTVLDLSTSNFPVFEKILELLNNCNGVAVQFNFKNLFDYFIENQSGPILDFFESAFLTNDIYRNITRKNWPEEADDIVILQTDNVAVTDKQVQDKLDSYADKEEKDDDEKEDKDDRIDVSVTRVNFTINKFRDMIEKLNDISDKE